MGIKVKINKVKEVLLEKVEKLPEKDIQEVINFIEFLKLREDEWFIDYVNKRAKEALKAKAREEKFMTLKELQEDYS